MLVLPPSTIGVPDWEQLSIGDITSTSDQWFHYSTKRWKTVPWFSKDNIAARIDSPVYRRPISLRAKVAAWWAALPKIIKYGILGMKQK